MSCKRDKDLEDYLYNLEYSRCDVSGLPLSDEEIKSYISEYYLYKSEQSVKINISMIA